MMPKLKAEEALAQIQTLRVGTAKVKRGAASAYVRKLRRQATRGKSRPTQATPERMRAAGIAVRR